MLDEFFADEWARAHDELAISPELKALDDLLAMWGGDGRHYHSLAHLKQGLIFLDPYDESVTLVRLAWFFHDAIYETGRGDNEQRSGDWFATYTSGRGLSAELVERGERLIRLTKDHQGALTDDPLWPIMNDVDLGIFAASREAYDAYANNVWNEYKSVVTRQQFVLGRAAFMAAFKSRPIFLTEAMKAREPVARANIDAEIARLRLEAERAGWA